MLSNIRKMTSQLWGAIVAGGIVSILVGLATMLWPHQILSIFIYLFSIFVIIVSVIVLGQAFSNIATDRLWWMSMLFSICGICIGVFILANPAVAQGLIAVLLAIYIFSQALMDLIVASYTDDPRTKTPVLATGIIGILFGFVVLFYPRLSTEALVWVIGLYILAHGILVEYYSIKTRRTVKRITKDVRAAMSDAHDDVEDSISEAKVINKKSTSKRAKAKTKKAPAKKK